MLGSWVASIPLVTPTWLPLFILYISAISEMQTARCSKDKGLDSMMHLCLHGWLQTGRCEMAIWEPKGWLLKLKGTRESKIR